VRISTGFETTSTIASFFTPADALGQDRHEQVGVAVDQVEPALVRLAAQPGRDADDVARRDVLVAAGGDHLIGGARPAVQAGRAPGPRPASALTSSSAISRTMPPHCSANAAHEPTSPPPPMMETFMVTVKVGSIFGRHLAVEMISSREA
jgi:hypothetical protein